MRVKLLVVGLLSSGMLAGCTSAVKSPKEPLQQISENQAAQLDKLKPEVDFEKAARLYVELGLSYLKEGYVGRAKTKLLRAKKLAPQLPEVYSALGYYMENVGEIDQAKSYYQQAISKDPKAGAGHNNYGAFLCRQGYYKESEPEFLKATEDPQYATTAEAYENAGLCVEQIPNLARAKELFLKAVRMDPRRTEALIELTYLSYKEGDYAKALEYHSLYADQASHTPRSLWLGIQLAKHFKDYNKVASYETLLKNRFPKSSEAQQMVRETS